MHSQFYTAGSGLIVQERRLQAIANNLANANTPAFRAQRVFSSLTRLAGEGSTDTIRVANSMSAVAGAFEAPGSGRLRTTGNALDLALPDGQVLAVESAGGPRYTRAGSLAINANGELVDSGGRRVLDNERRPIVGLAPDAAVQGDGALYVDGAAVARLLILDDVDGVLVPEGESLLTAEGNDGALQPVAAPAIQVGVVEQSSTDPLRELIDLIDAQRSFQRYQRVIDMTMNEVNRRAVSDIAATG